MSVKLTDQELNEWVAEKVMGLKRHEVVYDSCYGGHGGTFDCKNCKSCFASPPWNAFKINKEWCGKDLKEDYCNDLNHTHLMEEKIRRWGLP